MGVFLKPSIGSGWFVASAATTPVAAVNVSRQTEQHIMNDA
jgi:hypothetical protein